MDTPYDVHVLDTSAALDAGGSLEASFKTWAYRTGEVYWELRRLLMHRASPKAQGSLQACTEVKAGRMLWAAEFAHLDCGRKPIIPSSNAARVSGDADAMRDSLTRQEFSISTSAMLALMLFWYRTSRLKANRDRCRALLQGFLERAGGHLATETAAILDCLASESPLCAPQAELQHRCAHGDHAASALSKDSTGWRAMVDACADLRISSNSCPTARLALVRFVCRLSADIDRKIHARSPEINAKSDLRHRPLLARGTKRLRVDEDYKANAAVKRLCLREAPNVARAIRADGLGCSASNGRHWEISVCLEHQAACRAQLSGARVLHITEDGSRVGDPAEETVIYLAWVGDLNLGGYLPPQVQKHG